MESAATDWSTLGVWAGVLLTIMTLVASALMAVGSIMSKAMWRSLDESKTAITNLAQQYNDNRVQIETATNTLLATKIEVKDLLSRMLDAEHRQTSATKELEGRLVDRVLRLENSGSSTLVVISESNERIKALEREIYGEIEKHKKGKVRDS